jgi:hypothetical protein
MEALEQAKEGILEEVQIRTLELGMGRVMPGLLGTRATHTPTRTPSPTTIHTTIGHIIHLDGISIYLVAFSSLYY